MTCLPVDATDFKVHQLRQVIGESAKCDAISRFNNVASRCESPIERLLLAALVAGIGNELRWLTGDFDPDRGWSDPFHGYAQATVGPYRADLLIVDHGNHRLIVVECDGHDFHERTKEQARRDRSRDRWMTEKGVTVLRFTGSEIFGDAASCASQIYSVMMK